MKQTYTLLSTLLTFQLSFAHLQLALAQDTISADAFTHHRMAVIFTMLLALASL